MRRLLLVCALLCGAAYAGLPASAQAPPRIVAIGDIHGSIEGFTSILKVTGLIDSANKWIGGKAQLMQTGDYVDRGAGTRAVLDLLMALEPQARKAGGRAFALLGNHEVMNLIGETRDATPEIFASFADADSDKRRESAWQDYAKLAASKQAKGEPVPSVYAQTKEQWLAAHPPGFVEYKAAIGPKGKYGTWLRAKPMVTLVDGTIFMHAGIPPDAAPAQLDDLNTQLRDEIRRMDRFVEQLVDLKLATPSFTLQEVLQVASSEIGLANARIAEAKAAGTDVDMRKLNMPMLKEAQEVLKVDTWLSINADQALWYRGLSTLPDDPAGGPFAALLQRYQARRFVTGHTPQAGRSIHVRFGGRAVLIDTGMLTRVYKGRASALEISGDALTAYYEDGKVTLH
jgi:hypothetical protein